MQPISFWARIEAQDDGLLVTFPDVPQALTQGDDPADAAANAADALAVALEGYLKRGLDLPVASGRPADEAGVDAVEVAVPPALAARLLLAQTMKAQRLTKVGLAERMAVDESMVRKILAGRGVSLDKVLAALAAVGVRPALAA